ncbi:putative galacturonosyltransferase-like 3 [Abeliophyllum distichum]|uniref:Hexosyltransferase n=1 Tax=Abeliophyllum distichum TaxID=126358 RepID=A0ABD1U2B7_9LAMI
MPPNLHLLVTAGVTLLLLVVPHSAAKNQQFREAPAFRNGKDCQKSQWSTRASVHDNATIHIAMTLDYSSPYLRGSIAGVLSVLQHSTCPENTVFHFLATSHHHPHLRRTITATFPYLNFHLYPFNPTTVNHLISSSIRRALDQPLNYARIYLADLLPPAVTRIIYLDSDLIVIDDIAKLWRINLNSHVLGCPRILPCKLQPLFHFKILDKPNIFHCIQRPQTMLFQHWRDGN